MKATVAGTRSGFEVFRRIVREEDPVTEDTEYGLRFALQQLIFQKCTAISETIRLLKVTDTNHFRVQREDWKGNGRGPKDDGAPWRNGHGERQGYPDIQD